MSWKETLAKLEQRKMWDEAIDFMNEVIKESPNEPDSYIFMIYFMFNLLLEENYDDAKDEEYVQQATRYFEESYSKFAKNPEYLYFCGRFIDIAYWLFGAEEDDGEAMMKRAYKLDPESLVWSEPYVWELAKKDPASPQLKKYAERIQDSNNSLRAYLKSKGAVGQYILESIEETAQAILKNFANQS
jgi:hypothetical protein